MDRWDVLTQNVWQSEIVKRLQGLKVAVGAPDQKLSAFVDRAPESKSFCLRLKHEIVTQHPRNPEPVWVSPRPLPCAPLFRPWSQQMRHVVLVSQDGDLEQLDNLDRVGDVIETAVNDTHESPESLWVVVGKLDLPCVVV